MRPSTAPAGVERFALSRGEAAFMACVSVGTFDKMVEAGVMPAPRAYGARRLWLRPEVERALLELPGSEIETSDVNPWDGAS
jgi:hypothetical protein